MTPLSRPFARLRALRGERSILALILAFHLALGAGYAIGTPAWEAPDEPAHYNYIRHLAETGDLPGAPDGRL